MRDRPSLFALIRGDARPRRARLRAQLRLQLEPGLLGRQRRGDSGLDTGSIQSTATHSLQGYGGIRMQVDGAPKTPLLNGVMLRGFGLTFDGSNSFSSHHAVSLGGVAVTRSLIVNQEKNYARFFDTFTNESRFPLSVDIDFGGQFGYDLTTPINHQSTIFATSSGDTTATPADSWVAVDTPSEVGNLASASQFGPSAVVLGTAGSAFTQTSDFLTDPFNKPLQTTGDEANEYGYINHFQLQPGQTRSLVHFVVIGLSEKTESPAKTGIPAPGSQTTAVETQASELAATPDLSGLTTGQLCSIVNWSEASIKAVEPSLQRRRMRRPRRQRTGSGGRTARTDHKLALQRGRQIDHRRARRDERR